MRHVAQQIRAEVANASARFRAWSDADASRSRADGKWSRKEILGHLIDSATNNHQRFVRAQFASPFVWPGYDQVAWVEVHQYRARAWTELLDLWVAVNGHLASVVESVPDRHLGTICIVGEEAHPLEWWIKDYVRHLKHHVAQIEQESP